jgi:GYF domain 2
MPITTLNLASQLASAEFWYVHSEGATFGPFTPGQMDALCQQQRLGPQTMVVPAGETNWLALETYVPEHETIRTPTSAELEELVGVASLPTAIETSTELAGPDVANLTSSPEPEGPTQTPARFGSLKRVFRRS